MGSSCYEELCLFIMSYNDRILAIIVIIIIVIIITILWF